MNDIYVGQLFSDSYLEHHGILGMKWGVRRFQNKDGSLTPVGKKRKISNENKREETRKAVREYTKKFNKASKASDEADELWKDAKGAYKSTGKTGITRVINNATKGKFADSQTKKAISEYSKKYDKASKASDYADELWRDAKSAYKSTGKNALSRVANNIKYDPDRENGKTEKVSNRKLANTVNKTYKKELSKAYSESTEKLERATGKRYYDLVDSIQKTAAKNTTDRITQKYGKLSTQQEAFLSASRKGSDYMTSMRILREDGGVKPRKK